MSLYCDTAPGHAIHGPYHDHEYGFPATDERVLFERLSLEIFQAGLSWELVLKKRSAIFEAFAGFNVDKVAVFDGLDTERLLQNAAIIRNRLKIAAIIENAKRVQGLRCEFGGFHEWLQDQHPHPLQNWVKLFKATFKFMGPEVVQEFLMSTGYLPGAHRPDCPIFANIIERDPPWRHECAAMLNDRLET